jgi:hypothetical protein
MEPAMPPRTPRHTRPMARDYMLRQHLNFMDRCDRPCAKCGHRDGHREYQATQTVAIVNGVIEITTIPHPKYRPLLFACTVDGCDCEIQLD